MRAGHRPGPLEKNVRLAFLSIGRHIHTERWIRWFAAQGHECPTLERLRIIEVDSVQLHAGHAGQHSHFADKTGNQSGIEWCAGSAQPAADESAVDQHCVGQGHP